MIEDSGERRQFESGAVRDIQEDKGRCDLLPLYEVSELLNKEYDDLDNKSVIGCIDLAIGYQEFDYIYDAIAVFVKKNMYYDRLELAEALPDAVIEVSKHFQEGAKKYGDNNWRKGIPAHCYIDSGIRHYLKFMRGDVDDGTGKFERHDRAFIWNMLCFIWTIRNRPECDDVFSPGYFNDKEIEKIMTEPKITMKDVFALLRGKESSQEYNPDAPSDSIAKANGITRIDGETVKYEDDKPKVATLTSVVNGVKEVNTIEYYICPTGNFACAAFEKNGGSCNGDHDVCKEPAYKPYSPLGSDEIKIDVAHVEKTAGQAFLKADEFIRNFYGFTNQVYKYEDVLDDAYVVEMGCEKHWFMSEPYFEKWKQGREYIMFGEKK